jgi:hypothetical protein
VGPKPRTLAGRTQCIEKSIPAIYAAEPPKTTCPCHEIPRRTCVKQSHTEAIRIYRQEEQRSRADAKAVKRARQRIAKRG